MSRRGRLAFVHWLAVAAAVHGLVWCVWRVERKTNAAVSNPMADVVELELLYEVTTAAEAADDNAKPSPEVAIALDEAPRPVGSDRAEVARSAQAAETAKHVPPSSDDVAVGLIEAQPGETPTADGASERSSSLVQAGAPRAPASGDPAARLAELGIGRHNAAALRPYLDHQPLALAQDRLDQNLAQAIVDRDRDHSMGVEGPITNALHTGAMGTIAPRSLSKIAIIIGRDGKLADFRIIETNRDARGLHALSERVRNLLGNQVVRLPSGRPMEFIYELKSEVLLPSGRAPGLGIEVLGLPLKSAEDKSTKLSILTPKLKFESLVEPDPEKNGKITQTPPQIGISTAILGIDGDPVDIGSTGRQVVRTRLIRQRVL